MPKKEYTNLPPNYPVCGHADCPMAANCLHQIAYAEKMESDEYLQLINPTRCTRTADCAYYRDNTPVVYARGFTNFQRKMYPDQYDRFKTICIRHWSRNPYFERRRGDRALPPKEQEFILEALKKAGVTEEMIFDHYEHNFNWYD